MGYWGWTTRRETQMIDMRNESNLHKLLFEMDWGWRIETERPLVVRNQSRDVRQKKQRGNGMMPFLCNGRNCNVSSPLGSLVDSVRCWVKTPDLAVKCNRYRGLLFLCRCHQERKRGGWEESRHKPLHAVRKPETPQTQKWSEYTKFESYFVIWRVRILFVIYYC